MANKMAFHESYGELPFDLLRLMRERGVTPAEFQEFEYAGMTFDEMSEAITNHSPRGYFDYLSWMSEGLGW